MTKSSSPVQRGNAGGASSFGRCVGYTTATPPKQLPHRVQSSNRPSCTARHAERQCRIDQRLAFLACAAARLDLVEAGVLTLDEALDDAFVEKFREIAEIPCRCQLEVIERWDRLYPHRRRYIPDQVNS